MREELKKNRRLLFPVCKGCAQIQGKKSEAVDSCFISEMSPNRK